MKKAALLLLVLALAFAAYRFIEGGEEGKTKAPLGSAPPAQEEEAALPTPSLSTDSATSTAISTSTVSSVATDAAPALAPRPSAYFPNAKVISVITLPGKKAGESRKVKIVETKMSQPFVRIEETYEGTGAGAVLKAEAAMVSNQILIKKPAELTEPAFIGFLNQAGATNIKKTGSAFLVTFRADPKDPNALETFMAKVRELSNVPLVIEPNYIRKII